MSLFKKVAKSATKKVFKPAAKAAARAIGGAPSPNLRQIRRAVVKINPIRGIKKVTEALQLKPKQRRKGRR